MRPGTLLSTAVCRLHCWTPSLRKTNSCQAFSRVVHAPNGQLPAYEWALGDVNPPVHARWVWRVYKIDKKQNGRADRAFLVWVFHKLLLNFT